MKISIEDIVRDFLALRGESPDLLPMLGEDEEAPVLTLRRALAARVEAEAIRATLAVDPERIDTVKKVEVSALPVRLPGDYLRMLSLRMDDWDEPLRGPEPEDSLRRKLGRNAPAWMTCRHRPMAVERRDSGGLTLEVYGTGVTHGELLYIPRPRFDGARLTVSTAAYREMWSDIPVPAL